MEVISKQSILEMARGAFLERTDYEMGKVIDNILDPNTKATAKRKITITLELTPDEDRSTFRVNTVAKAALVPTNPVTTTLCVTSDPGTGEVAVVEMVPQIPGQLSMDGTEQSNPKILKFLKRA